MFLCVICEKRYPHSFEQCMKCGARESCAPFLPRRAPLLSETPAEIVQKTRTVPDWDRLLGGGVAAGAIVLVGGEPGAGKTTEMLRLAQTLGTEKEPAIYAFAERDREELAAHALLTGIGRHRISTLPISKLSELSDYLYEGAHVFVDSWGALSDVEIEELDDLRSRIKPGSAWCVCHMTKKGDIEGPEKLQHRASAVVFVKKKTLFVSKNWHGPSMVEVKREHPFFSRKDEAPARRKVPKLDPLHD